MPTGQSVQFVLPFLSEYVPGPHVMQASELVEAVSLLKVPAWQSLHVAVPSVSVNEPGGQGLQNVDAI